MHEVLKDPNLPTHVFANGWGRARRQVHYPLADEPVLLYLFRLEKREQDFATFQRETIQRIANLVVRFGDAAEQLIAEALQEMGWTILERPRNP